jgi:hypothetical protein
MAVAKESQGADGRRQSAARDGHAFHSDVLSVDTEGQSQRDCISQPKAVALWLPWATASTLKGLWLD